MRFKSTIATRLRASKAAGVPVVIRKAERGFHVAMETPDRKSRRGRKPAA